MTRALIEALEGALVVFPDLLEPSQLAHRFPKLVAGCIRAANEIRIGSRSERDLSMLVYGRDDVPRATLQRLLTRTKLELERSVHEADPEDSDDLNRLPWMSVLHLYSAGITAYAGSSDYRTGERLASVISAAKDAYMLPMAISSGVLLTLHRAQHDKPSRMLRAREATRKVLDDFLDCWEWISTYAELLSIVRRRYGMKVRRARIVEIREALDGLLLGGLKGMAPQAQMVAALCAYMVGQLDDNATTIIQWADVYKRASMAVDKTSRLYQRTSRRMYLRAYMVARDYKNSVPVLEQILIQEFTSIQSQVTAEYATYIVWLTRGLLTQKRYSEALANINLIDTSLMKRAPENVRTVALLYRAVASQMTGTSSDVLDRRLLRVAMIRNESSSRRASQHNLRLGALTAILIHLYSGGTAGVITPKEVAEKLLLMVNMHSQVRTCARTAAFIRTVAVMENVEHISVAQVHRSVAVKRQMKILASTTPDFDLEIALYEELLHRIYGDRLRELLAEPEPKRKPRRKKTP
ncbi:MAG: hypothetical protein ACKOE4_02690 [Candidatus Kapaibacterium sp.]